MNLAEFLQKTFIEKNGCVCRPRIICNDGFDMSVQASYGHYCSPRINTYIYNSVEIGFPNQEEPLIFSFAEDKEDYMGTVYGWTPCDIAQKVIDKHNGINVEKTFNVENMRNV
jgi:hypothetical protein